MLTNLNGTPRDIRDSTKNIQHIYRDILKLYYVRELLTKLRKMAPVYGEIWLYKDATGKAMLSMLLNMAEEMTTKLNQSLSSFFNTTIALFDAKVRETKITQEEDCFSAMAATRDQYSQFTAFNAQAKEQIHTIKAKVGTFAPSLAKADETKYLLLKALVEFIESCFGQPGTGAIYPEEYEILKRALNEASFPKIPEPIPSEATNPIALIEAQYKTLRKLRIKAAGEIGVTKLDLSACRLSALSKKDRKELCLQLASIATSSITTEVDLKDNAFYDVTEDSEEEKKIATAILIQIVRKLPASVTTLYLAGNGIKYYNHAELSALFSGFPQHINKVSLRGEEPLELSQQLARLVWPRSYYNLTQGKHDFMDIAKTLLLDYTKSCGFELFITLHWNRHLTAEIRKIHKKIGIAPEFDTGEKLFTALDTIDKKSNYHGGSFSRRYTFLSNCYSGKIPSLESSRSHDPATKAAAPQGSDIELGTM